MKPEILMTSGYLEQTLERIRTQWRPVDIPGHGEALEYLRGCERLPLVVVIGFVPRMPHPMEGTTAGPPDAIPPAPEMLREILGIDSDLPVLVSTSVHHPRRIVELIKRGAFGYVVEPADKTDTSAMQRYHEELELLLDRAVRWRRTILENRRLQKSLERERDFPRLISRSPAMDRVTHMASKVAPTPATVLITGESGTGKDLLAKRIHRESKRPPDAFVAINCGAMSEPLLSSELFGHVKGAFTGAEANNPGLIRQAGEGTLFLDEVEAIPPGFQVLLLRLLEERIARPVGGQTEYPVRCRFIAATNRALEPRIADGKFRQDLYYRLNVFHIDLPPLRRRAEDIPLLADFFLRRAAGDFGRDLRGIAPGAMDLLEAYPWPGNIRELRNVIERAAILCEGPRLSPADVSGSLKRSVAVDAPARDYARAMEQFESRLIRHALNDSGGNVSAAARTLKMKRTTLRYRMRRLGLPF